MRANSRRCCVTSIPPVMPTERVARFLFLESMKLHRHMCDHFSYCILPNSIYPTMIPIPLSNSIMCATEGRSPSSRTMHRRLPALELDRLSQLTSDPPYQRLSASDSAAALLFSNSDSDTHWQFQIPRFNHFASRRLNCS